MPESISLPTTIEKLCECGCGKPTTLAKETSRKRGYIKGEPCRFIAFHHLPIPRELHPSWKGGKSVTQDGILLISKPDHPRARSNGYVPEYVLIAEKALGKPLSSKHPVHHFDENKSNNANTNLVICENQSYHLLLHARMRVLKAGGDPNSDGYCSGCNSVKNKSEFGRNSSKGNGLANRCRLCTNAKGRRFYAAGHHYYKKRT